MKRVYFLRPVGENGPIKIGCSKEPENRIRALTIWSPAPLELVAMVPGDHREESILHQMFGHRRVHGEWFEITPELSRLLEYVERAGKLPPLDYSLSPYRSGRKSKMPRRTPNARRLDKWKITKALLKAERRAYGFGGAEYMRPDEIQAIHESYQGFHAEMPTPEQLAVVQEYIDKLNELPSASTDLQAWCQWHKLVLASKAA